MEVFRLVKNYKIFKGDVEEPFVLVGTLSNGDKIGKCIMDCKQENTVTKDEVFEYIKANHIEEIEE